MKLYDLGLTIIFAMIIGLCCLAPTKHNLGYEKAIYVEDAIEWDQPYYSIYGVEDKVFWDRSTPLGKHIYKRSKYLASIVGYEGDDIACSPCGWYLYIGVDMDVLIKYNN